MTYKCLLYDVQDRIATLTLNRPERLNALGDTLREDLYDAVTKAAADPNVGVLVITGAGRGFCSGGDVKSMSEREPDRSDGACERATGADARPDHPGHARLSEADHRGDQRCGGGRRNEPGACV